MKKDHKYFPPYIKWILIGILFVGLVVWVLLPKPVPVEVAPVTKGPFEQLVVEEGKTRAKDIFEIQSPVDGNLLRVPHKAGDKVQAGDFLAEVEWPKPWKLTSPVSGSILSIQRESGGPIRRGETIMEVADPSNLEVVSEILTEDAVTIEPGAPVRIQSWGGCQDLEGKVRLVEPKAFTKVSALGIEEQRVNVIIDITSPKEKCAGLAHGFRVNNLISVYKTEDALTVPTGALFRIGDTWAVFKYNRGRAEKTPVKIEKRNPEQAMVVSGLQPGDQVIVYPSDKIEDGIRVEPFNHKPPKR